MIWKIGHRGASGMYPENTMLAFRKAVEMGVDAIELDVYACKSGEAVVFHDDTLERTTNGHGRVDAHTLAELQKLDAGRGEKIPTLKEVLAEFAANIIVFIEIKSVAASAPVAKLISEFAKLGMLYSHMPVIGFDDSWLVAARNLDPKIIIGTSPDETKQISPDYCAHVKKLNAWSINPCIDQLDEAFVKTAHQHGLKVITWTVNEPDKIRHAKMLGVDGIISDFPDRL